MKNPPDYGDYNISGPGKFRNLKIDAIPKDSIKKGRVVTYQSPTMNLKACSSIAAAAASEAVVLPCWGLELGAGGGVYNGKNEASVSCATIRH